MRCAPTRKRRRRGKKGFGEALAQAQRGEAVYFAEALRLGLHGQVQARWGGSGRAVGAGGGAGVRVAVLGVGGEPVDGGSALGVRERLLGAALAPVVAEWGVAGVVGLVWDGVVAHRSSVVRVVGVPTVVLPAYSPELNPAERLCSEVRCRVEGVVYGGDLEAKVAVVADYLGELGADLARVRSLVGWGWIVAALEGRDECLT